MLELLGILYVYCPFVLWMNSIWSKLLSLSLTDLNLLKLPHSALVYCIQSLSTEIISGIQNPMVNLVYSAGNYLFHWQKVFVPVHLLFSLVLYKLQNDFAPSDVSMLD